MHFCQGVFSEFLQTMGRAPDFMAEQHQCVKYPHDRIKQVGLFLVGCFIFTGPPVLY